MKRVMHIIRLSSVLLVTSLLYVSCGEKETLKPDGPTDNDKVTFYQSDGIIRYIDYSALDSIVNGTDVTKYFYL